MENKNWQDEAVEKSGVKVPEWELEPMGAEQKENVEVSVEAEPSVADKRLEELTVVVKEVAPENPEQKAANVEALQAEIAEMVPEDPEQVEAKPETEVVEMEAETAWGKLKEKYPEVSENTRYGEIEDTIKSAHSRHEDHYGYQKRALITGGITAPVATALIVGAPAALGTLGALLVAAPFTILGYGVYKKFKRYQEKKIIKRDTTLLNKAFSR